MRTGPTRNATLPLALLALVLLPACSHSDRAAPSDSATAAGATAAASDAAAASGGTASVLHFTLTGGPDAGSYDATSSDVTCSFGLAGKDAWGNQYSDADKKDGLTSVQLIVPDAAGAANGTGTFDLTVTIGPFISGGRAYQVQTRPGQNGKGSGTVTIDDKGQSATVTVKGTTADKVGIDGTIDCNKVMRMGA